MREYKEVARQEFADFLDAYPRKLVASAVTICQPERMQYNDFTLGNWPASVVASYEMWGHTLGDIWGPDPGKWQILIDAPQNAG